LAAENNSVEGYLEEGLLAVIPVYEEGCKTVILTLKGRRMEPRSLIWLVKKFASHYDLDLVSLRRRCGVLLNLKHHISLPMSENLVLLPIRARKALAAGDITIGYINLKEVKEIAVCEVEGDEGNDAPLSVVTFNSGTALATFNTAEKLNRRLEQGEKVLRDFLQRRSRGARFSGLKRDDLVEKMPDCDCLLRELFLERFEV